MKKILTALLILSMLFALAACGIEEKPAPVVTEEETTVPEEEEYDTLPGTVQLKSNAQLVIGESSFDVKSLVELQEGQKASDLRFSVVSSDNVASVDANGILTRKGDACGQVSVQIYLDGHAQVFSIVNVTFAPANLYGGAYRGGFKKADGTLGNEITLVLNSDKTFTLTVGAGLARYGDVDYELDSAVVGEFNGTFTLDPSSATPLLLTCEAYSSSEQVKAAFGSTTSGDFCIRIKLFTATVEGSLKSVVVELTAASAT